MAEIDGSIPASAGKNVPPLMQNLGQLAQTMSAVNANRLFQAKAAAGQLLQQSIDPSTGQPDLSQFNRLLARDPRTAPYASEALTASLAQQGAGITNATNQRSLQAAQGDIVRRAIGSLGPNATHDAIFDVLRQLVTNREITPDFGFGVAGSIPGDPAMVGSWARNNFQLPALGPDSALAAQTPKPTATNIGGKTVFVSTPNKGMGEPTVEGDIANTLSPEAKASRQTVMGPGNVPQSVPTSALVSDTGEPKAGVPGITGKHGEVATGLAPGVASAAETAGTGSASILNADRADQAGSAQRITILKKLDTLLASPGGQTGPGTQAVNTWRNFLLANAPALAGIGNGGLTEAKIRAATQDELKKYMTQVAGAAASQYGQGTNEKLAVAASGNANPDLSNLANRDVTRMNLALERAKQARIAAFDATPGETPQTYGKFSSTWNRTIDPRAFMLDLLSKDERAKMLSTVRTDAEKRALLKGKQAAEAAGLYSEADIPR